VARDTRIVRVTSLTSLEQKRETQTTCGGAAFKETKPQKGSRFHARKPRGGPKNSVRRTVQNSLREKKKRRPRGVTPGDHMLARREGFTGKKKTRENICQRVNHGKVKKKGEKWPPGRF